MNSSDKYSPRARILLDVLQGKCGHVWSNVWSRFVVASLVEFARGQIAFSTGYALPGFSDLDDPIKRSRLVDRGPLAVRACSELLLQRSTILNELLIANGQHSQSKSQLRKLLEDGGVVPALIAPPKSVALLASMDLKEIWAPLAHKIAKAIHADEVSGNRDPEWLLWNKLLLTRFLYGCQLQAASEVAGHLMELARALHGPRSSLIAITERVSSEGIVDPPLSELPSSGSQSASLKTVPLSDLIAAVQDEHDRMLSGNGIIHRITDVNAPASIPAHLRDRITHNQLVVCRDHAYRQHEAAILCYGALSVIEQLLRSVAAHVGIDHLKMDGVPRPAASWISDPRLSLDNALLVRLQELYSPDGPNLRNRAMHAGLLETRSRSMEVTLAANTPKVGLGFSQNPLLAENLLKLLMRDLEALDAHAASVNLCAKDFSWSARVWLSDEEVEFVHRISCDVLDPDRSEEWRRQLFSFVDLSLASFSTYTRVAWIGWLQPYERHSSLIAFLAWGVVFEGLFRLTLHVLGIEVIQRSHVTGANRMFQYRMLDERPQGLCAPDAIAALVAVLRPEDHDAAARTIALAVKARNAMTHGAIFIHDERDHLGAGHLFIKATQLLMSATKQHMTLERAYYRFLARTDISASQMEDWLNAEKDIDSMFDRPTTAGHESAL